MYALLLLFLIACNMTLFQCMELCSSMVLGHDISFPRELIQSIIAFPFYLFILTTLFWIPSFYNSYEFLCSLTFFSYFYL